MCVWITLELALKPRNLTALYMAFTVRVQYSVLYAEVLSTTVVVLSSSVEFAGIHVPVILVPVQDLTEVDG